MWLVLLPAALASPTGPPLPDPDLTRIDLVVRADSDAWPLALADCDADSACDAVRRDAARTLAGSVTLARGVAVYGEWGWTQPSVGEAGYSATGTRKAAGLRLGWPVAGMWGLAGNLRVEAEDAAGTNGETEALRAGQLSAMATWGDPLGGLVVWGGAQASVLWRQSLSPLGLNSDGEPLVSLTLSPARPASAVFGAALWSDSLGAPWRRGARITLGAEGWLGQSNGGSAWIGLGF